VLQVCIRPYPLIGLLIDKRFSQHSGGAAVKSDELKQEVQLMCLTCCLLLLLNYYWLAIFSKRGVDILLTGFLHYTQEVEDFGWRVRPLVRALPSLRLQQQQQGLPTGAVGAD